MMKLSLAIFLAYLSLTVNCYKDTDVDGYFAKEKGNGRVKPILNTEENPTGVTETELAASRQVESKNILSRSFDCFLYVGGDQLPRVRSDQEQSKM